MKAAEKTAAAHSLDLDNNMEAHQQSMIQALKEGLASMSTKENNSKDLTLTHHTDMRNFSRYADTANPSPPIRQQLNPEQQSKMGERNRQSQGNYYHRNRIPKLEEVNRSAKPVYEASELTDLYFYTNLQGNSVVIRRSLKKSILRGKEELIKNFNYHPTSGAGIGQIICRQDTRKSSHKS